MYDRSCWYCNRLRTHLISLGVTLIIGWAFAAQGLAYNVSITWDPSPGPDIAGYVIDYGMQSGNYEYEIDVGNVTEFDLESLNDEITYYIAVRAYNWAGEFSDYSNEVVLNGFNGSSDPVADALPIPSFEMSLVRVDSEELHGEDGQGENAIDGDPSTFWHTEWHYADPVHPHEIVIDLGYERQVCGFSYLPRQDGCYNGGIAAYELYVSTDDHNWGNPVATGVFPSTRDKQEVSFNARLARYVRLVALSEVAGHAWTSAAEIEVMEQAGGYVNENLNENSRAGIPYWEMSLVRVDSEELHGEDGQGENAIDGDPSTFWHTEWHYADPVHPHEIVIDLGYERQVCGFSYLPRQDGCYNGGIAAYELYVSTDDHNWGNPVATGVFPSTRDKQEVSFNARLARYVRLVALSEVAGHAWTSAAEIEVMELW